MGFDDLLLLAQNYGEMATAGQAGAAAAVPEPASIATRREDAAMLAFVSFVEANRRVPSIEEMVQIGVLTEPASKLDSDKKNFLRRVAELVLAEQNDSTGAGSS